MTAGHYAYDPLGRRISKHRVSKDGTEADRTEFPWDDSALAEQIVPDGRVTTWGYAPGSHRPVVQTAHLPHDTSGNTSFLTRLAEESDCEFAPRLYAVVRDRPV
ncbi:hypothetical protein [Streptomyces misionensis]|uniref:hypothetical protein n=1 Tax=Streptomyces misionensis TaxID=67331 RepID=UPI00396BF750